MRFSALSTIAMLVGVASHAAHAQTPHTVDVYAADYAFVAPDTIRAGATAFHLVNRGPSRHHLTIFALPAGMSLDTFDRILRTEGGGHGIRAIGGTETPAEGRRDAWAMLDLAPGQYVLMCMLPLPDGSGTHRSRGMFRPLTVLPAQRHAAMARADVVVRMTDYAFVSPDTFRAGRQWVRFENEGHHAHLALVLRFVTGKTLADLAAWQANPQGPNPTTNAGGVTEMAAGQSAMVRLDLEPGHYLLVCIDTDGTEPRMHAELGMVREFSVSSGARQLSSSLERTEAASRSSTTAPPR